ncbi:MAG: CoB--CoM heterodisulfide reductase iron-sulfur subunit A family protein [Candidatus Hydrogenedentes bacterium]|nr:CoB--CoM heterodisulfide reductase iron-sulfur subunit A family protein [Candidatus Hydrogenedentota bacterium]
MSDAVLVIGGGIAGLRSALDLAHAGARVIVLESRATIGGKLASLLEEGGGGLDLPEASWLPTLAAVAKVPDIEVLTLSELVDLKGEPGDFTATIRSRARFVTDVCDRCNVCRQVCPVVKPNEYDAGFTFRKAIFSPLRDPVPASYVVDIESCLNDPPNYVPCQRCVQNCHVHAIRFDMPVERTFTRDVGSVIVATGFDVTDLRGLDRYGYGTHPDIISSIELERLFAPSGVTGGYAERPSTESDPERVAVIVTDSSEFTWTYSGRHAMRLLDQAIENVTLIYEASPRGGQDPGSFLAGPQASKVRMVRGQVQRTEVVEGPSLRLCYRDLEQDDDAEADFDLIVVAGGVRPPAGLGLLTTILGVRQSSDGFIRTIESDGVRVATSRPGVYACGCVNGPKNIRESLLESAAAVEKALHHLGKRFQLRRAVDRDGSRPGSPDLRNRMEHVVASLLSIGEKRLSKQPDR